MQTLVRALTFGFDNIVLIESSLTRTWIISDVSGSWMATYVDIDYG